MCSKQCLIFPDVSHSLMYYFYLQSPDKKQDNLYTLDRPLISRKTLETKCGEFTRSLLVTCSG